MKTIIIIFFVALFSFAAYAQNTEPTQGLFNLDGQQKFLSPDSAAFKQTRYILGWHWGGGGKISSSLNCSQHDGYAIGTDASAYLNNTDIMVKPYNRGIEYSHGDQPSTFNAKSITFPLVPKLLRGYSRHSHFPIVSF